VKYNFRNSVKIKKLYYSQHLGGTGLKSDSRFIMRGTIINRFYFSLLLRNYPKPALDAKKLGKVLPGGGSTFEKNFVFPTAGKKPWDGQDKDQYFRDKYAHVHAQQRKERELNRKSPYKTARSFTKNKLARLEHAHKVGKTIKKEANILVQEKPKPSFARELEESLAKDRRREFLYGTGPVIAALQAKKRAVLKLHTRDSLADIPNNIREICKERNVKIDAKVPTAHLNIMTNNGVHNKYVLEVRPLDRRDVVCLGTFDSERQQVVVSEMLDGTLQDRFVRCGKLNKNQPLVLYIDEVTDVHNFGAIMRTAFYLGVDFIVHSEKNCSKLSPVVDKASAGAMEHIPIFNSPQPLGFFEKSKANGWNIIASTVGAPAGVARVSPSGLKDLLQKGPCMIVVGSEGEGLRTSLLQRSTHVVTWTGVQDKDKLDSLNVSVATGLLLSRFFHDAAFDGNCK
jgi:21S rRNA (GM2251-2'-O)-methyltransferase